MPRANQAEAAEPNAAVMSDAAAQMQDANIVRTRRVAPTSLPAKEVSTDDFKEPQLADIKMPELGKGLPERGDEQVAIADGVNLDKEYMEALSFMEQPVRIRIEPSNDDNPALTVDCWVNGKGAEVWDVRSKKWLELNILPVGIVCTTKRKYVEVLARSKQMKVRTPDHGDGRNVDNNNVSRSHHRGHVFSVIGDTEKGVEWLSAILSESF